MDSILQNVLKLTNFLIRHQKASLVSISRLKLDTSGKIKHFDLAISSSKNILILLPKETGNKSESSPEVLKLVASLEKQLN